MAYLHIYFNDALKSVIELKSTVTSVGRAVDNDVVIDNPGVSAYHAKIFDDDGRYMIEDSASKNGVFVNGKRVGHQPLNYGDTITIFKHTLKFSATGSYKAASKPISEDTHEVTQGATVEVNVSNLNDLLKERQNGNAYLLQMNGQIGARKFMLAKINFSLGKSREADLPVGGLFAPKVAAKIVRHSDGYYLTPEKRGKVRLNGTTVSKPAKLYDGDELVVRGTALKFFNRPSS
ncbi:MAG: FHA domain-containing protein [Pseudomonadota bacterium]